MADAGTTGVSCSAHPSACTLPPAAGNEPPNKNGTKTIIAISKLYLGDGSRQGKQDQNAWKSYGYNLDGLISKPTDVNHCTPQDGAYPPYVKTDGDGGVDNSFGENLVELLQLNNEVSIAASQSIADGKATVLFRLDNLVDPDNVPDQNGITGAIYEGTDKGSPAAFDGSDVWPVAAESVNGSVGAPKATFSGSYVSGGVWVSHGNLDVVLPIITQFYTLLLPIHHAVITMHIHGTGTGATASDGTIAGVVDPKAFDGWIWTVLPLDPYGCRPEDFNNLAQSFRFAADIMSDETNGDPAKTCNAISIGIGFEGTAASLGAVAPPAPPPPDSCPAEAGAPDAGPSDAGAD